MSRRAALDRLNYYGDPRVLDSMRTRYYEVVAISGDKAIIKLTDWTVDIVSDDDPDEYPDWFKRSPTHTYFAKCDSQTCYRCDGSRTMVNPSIDAGGLSRDDFDDPDFEEAYFGGCLLYTSPSPRDATLSRMPSSA